MSQSLVIPHSLWRGTLCHDRTGPSSCLMAKTEDISIDFGSCPLLLLLLTVTKEIEQVKHNNVVTALDKILF